MKFFVPDWDDRVDPGYDFLTDRFTLKRDPYRDDVYAHELLAEPGYDGLLVSRAALGEVGIPSVGLWGQVPHYLAGSPSPPATRAVLDRLMQLTGIAVDLGPLDRRIERYGGKVEAGLADRPDVAELVQAIEAEHPSLPSGDDLVDEIERFLRSQPDQD